MIEVRSRIRTCIVAAALACAAVPANAQDDDGLTTAGEVRGEISEAMDAVADFSEQERDQALTRAREALTQLDAEIERREQTLRENWAEMSDAARETARAQLREIRETRNALGERLGALRAGAGSAWAELKAGFSDAWAAFSEAWNAGEGTAGAD